MYYMLKCINSFSLNDALTQTGICNFLSFCQCELESVLDICIGLGTSLVFYDLILCCVSKFVMCINIIGCAAHSRNFLVVTPSDLNTDWSYRVSDVSDLNHLLCSQ